MCPADDRLPAFIQGGFPDPAGRPGILRESPAGPMKVLCPCLDGDTISRISFFLPAVRQIFQTTSGVNDLTQ